MLNPDQSVVASIQVKTRTKGRDGGWHMGKKHETVVLPSLFYCFVDFQPEVPVTYVVPSQVVAEVVSKAYRAWLTAPGKRGKPHQETKVRRVLPSYDYPVPGVRARVDGAVPRELGAASGEGSAYGAARVAPRGRSAWPCSRPGRASGRFLDDVAERLLGLGRPPASRVMLHAARDHGRYVIARPRCEQFFGLAEEVVVGVRPDALLHSDEQVVRHRIVDRKEHPEHALDHTSLDDWRALREMGGACRTRCPCP